MVLITKGNLRTFWTLSRLGSTANTVRESSPSCSFPLIAMCRPSPAYEMQYTFADTLATTVALFFLTFVASVRHTRPLDALHSLLSDDGSHASDSTVLLWTPDIVPISSSFCDAAPLLPVWEVPPSSNLNTLTTRSWPPDASSEPERLNATA
eukprot:scaffold1534_cov267-Pinguiococcus_pyrenoidosus.AAC.23